MTQPEKKQREILERRLVAAVADEFRYGALSDPDYGYHPERIPDHARAEGRAAEIRDLAGEIGLDLPANQEVERKAMVALRAEYGAAARRREELLREHGEVFLEIPGRLPEAQRRLVDLDEVIQESGPVLTYLEDVEENARWHTAVERERSSVAAETLRAAGYPEAKVSAFARAALAVDEGTDLTTAAKDNNLNPNDLYTYLQERGTGPSK